MRQATGGKIVVITFHGVPDMEHPAVGLEPATFKEMMQYLKDNHYKAIALRNLAEYIDPAKAAKLPPTANNVHESRPRHAPPGREALRAPPRTPGAATVVQGPAPARPRTC